MAIMEVVGCVVFFGGDWGLIIKEEGFSLKKHEVSMIGPFFWKTNKNSSQQGNICCNLQCFVLCKVLQVLQNFSS